MVETANKNKFTFIIAIGIMFVSLTIVPMIFYTQIVKLFDGLQQVINNFIAGQERANIRGNITTDLILTSINETRELQENITREDDERGQKFVKFLEAESEDMDEELDDLRNITLAIADRHNTTIDKETREDAIIFEKGVITFSNGTTVGIGNIFGER